MKETIKGLNADEYAAAVLAIRISKLLKGLGDMNEKWYVISPGNFPTKDGHDIAGDYIAICRIDADDIATNNKEARDLVTAVAARWGVDITIDGVDGGSADE